jgi:hypothetical protein
VSAGFVPVDAPAWTRQRLLIRGYWPEVLATIDLRYWADPIACGHQRRPSYRELANVWGWSLSKVARFVTDVEKWTDPYRRRDTSDTTAEHERNNDETTDHGATPTNPGLRNGGGTRAEQDRDTGETAVIGTRAGSTDTDTDTDTEIPGAVSGPAARRAAEREACAALWTHWRGLRRPAVDGKPGRLWHTSRVFDDDDRAKLTTQLRARAKAHRRAGLRFPADLQAAEIDCRDLIDCFHQAPACAHWQGVNDRQRVFLGLGTLFQRDKMGTRWETLAGWSEAGKPKAEAPRPVNGFRDEAEKAWPWLLELVATHGRGLPRTLRADDEAKDRAVWSGIEAAGGVSALLGRADQIHRLRWPFVDGYVQARQRETT